MSTVSPQRDRSAAADAAEAEDPDLLDGVTSEQVKHATDETRAEGEPYEDAE
ncbi:hypothetical protein OG455_04880 [Kitasatospora sp. NBC_01287]|uniref:hypothetical protein n=1 Tax=Kitasatospora sp. NBC_01287 TaxID=2903573 RepID=UPI00224FA23D|nr:hypothetical protein [Kitasatospora sp. NBC_01287]MCX4744860.1 hypothetical protein [Kitasatospora sp. NBC_01287]